MSNSNGAPNGAGASQPDHPEQHEEVLVDGGEEQDGPQEIFLDDADIAELQAAMDEEGDFPMDEDDEDDVEEVEEAEPEDGNGDDENDQEMDENIQDMACTKFRAHLNPVFSISTHPTCPVLAASGGEDDNGYLWRLDTGEEVAKLAGHTDSVITTGWSSDGELVATGGMDGRVRVWRRVKTAAGSDAWEWAKWEFLTTLEGMDEVTWLDWHPKGAVLVCGTGDGTVWMWQLPSGRNMNVFSGHTAPVTCGRFLPDGKRLVTGSEDGSLIVWDPKSSSPVFKLAGQASRFKFEGGVTCVAVNATSTAAIVGGADGALKVVNLTNGTVATALESHEEGSSVESVAWSQGTAGSVGLWITAGTDKKIKVFEASNGSVRWTGEHDDAVTTATLHPASTHLVSSGSVDRTVKTWDLRTGRLQKTHTGHQDVIHMVACSSDGKLLVSGSDDSTARVFVV